MNGAKRGAHHEQKRKQQVEAAKKALSSQRETNKRSRFGKLRQFKTPPLLHLFHFHRAIRRDLEQLLELFESLSPGGSVNEHEREELLARLESLRHMLTHHCASEDSVLLPVLIRKGCSILGQRDAAVCHDSTKFTELQEMMGTLEQHLRASSAWPRRAQWERLRDSIDQHLNAEEEAMSPFFWDSSCLDQEEQGRLLVKVIFAMPEEMQTRLVLKSLRELAATEDRCRFLSLIEQYATKEEFARIAGHVAQDMLHEEFKELSAQVPGLEQAAESQLQPLMEIRHIHMAFRKALEDLQHAVEDLDPMDDLQLRALSKQLRFLRMVHGVHSQGEDAVFLPELCKSDEDLAEFIHDDHETEDVKFAELLDDLERLSGTPAAARWPLMLKTRARIRGLCGHLIRHMASEESRLLPRLECHYPIHEQDRLVREVMRRIPEETLSVIMPWLLGSLPVAEQEKLVRNLLRSMPKSEFERLMRVVAKSVNMGVLDGRNWHELARRVSEIVVENNDDTANLLYSGPLAEIMRVHKAIRVDLQALAEAALQLDPESLNPRHVASLGERFTFLELMVRDHSNAEDRVVLPALAERVHGVVEEYENDHHCEEQLFHRLSQTLMDIQCAGTMKETRALVQKLRGIVRALRVDLMHHLEREETVLWPMLAENFSTEEQTEIVGQVFGQIPASRMRELLPWLVRVLSRHESANMMQHILNITRSTMFEQWLRTWFKDFDELVGGLRLTGSTDTLHRSASAALPSPSAADQSQYEAAAEGYIRRAMGDVERAIRTIAHDETLSERERTLLMQNVMISQWRRRHPSVQLPGATSETSAPAMDSKLPTSQSSKEAQREQTGLEERGVCRTYRPQLNAGSATAELGCRHYARACRLLAPCCQRYYTCRLCHDEENHHVMDRYAVAWILCMRCLKEQAPAESCCACKERFSRYVCLICKLYDDAPDRDIYHCGYCNVCRVGKGLGIDYFHCMKCNACMSTANAKKHRCVEHSLESDCPVCGEYLFTSTNPIKFLRCGHLMHATCYRRYAATDYRCPLCKKSLADMSAYFEAQLMDEPMPLEYRGIPARIVCNDCSGRSVVEFHFLYNKCPQCHSYNTQVLHVGRDPTA
jgi:iron-sulfur cluster repair protein YtfE (RIC family)